MDPSRVAELLFSSRSPEIDPETLQYLASFELDEDDDDDPDRAVRDVEDICASASKQFAALPADERTRRVVEFLSAVGSGAAKPPASTRDPADAAAAATAAALAAALAGLNQRDSNDRGGGGSSTDAKDAPRAGATDTDDDDDDADGWAEQNAAAIDALAGLIPSADDGTDANKDARLFAAHVLRDRCSGDADAAGEHLLALAGQDGGGLSGAVAEWRRLARCREDAAAREAEARERERQATLERFAWRPEGTGGGGGGGGGGGAGSGKPPPEVKRGPGGSGGGGGGASRVRYLDGAPVTTKGEKYVVVSQKEEWDGGSRGRVKTKGKRGVGFA
jgi:hypothetical protein